MDLARQHRGERGRDEGSAEREEDARHEHRR
jgi:hypothetical protein